MAKHFLQSTYWAQVRRALGNQVHQVDENILVLTKWPLLDKYLGYMPQVNLTDINWENLYSTAKQLKLSHVLIDSNDLIQNYRRPQTSQNLIETDSLIYRHNLLVNLNKGEEELLSEMKERARYNVRLALRKGVKVSIRDDEAAFQTFLSIFFETVNRQKFFGRAPKYYQTIWKILQPQGKVKIAIAELNGKALVAWMVYVDDGVIYNAYGGSSSEDRETKATYAMAYEVMLWGKQNGYHTLDMWGILGPDAKETDKEFGFHYYKTSLGGERVEYAPSFNLIIDPTAYKMFVIGNKVRWILLKLKKILLLH